MCLQFDSTYQVESRGSAKSSLHPGIEKFLKENLYTLHQSGWYVLLDIFEQYDDNFSVTKSAEILKGKKPSQSAKDNSIPYPGLMRFDIM